ncbi:helix-turn-helix domain-containing protein [Caulobacter zeae]|uniref:helix-turn-helix domain-containing protein n=1 Tax=Caulobacter zeae TaxID=2055137 RepID=UPI0013FD22D8|nr:AraC family transcriptional regulator [Caulobacter zeae]
MFWRELYLEPRIFTNIDVKSSTSTRHRDDPERQKIIAGGLDQYCVQLLTSGDLRGDCDGTAITASSGDICIFDLARPYVSEISSGARLTVIAPRQPIDRVAGGHSLHGLVLRADDPLARLLRNFIVDVHAVAGGLQADDSDAAEAALIEVLTMALARRRPETPPAGASRLGHRFRERMLEFIDSRLADPALNAETLMLRFGVSRANLYRLFAEDGGVASAIRDRRLDAAWLALVGTEAASVTEIALDLGFSSSGQFSRAFRGRFGVSPTKARAARQPDDT